MDKRIEAVRVIFETEYATPLKVRDLPRRVGLSRSQLGYLFKKEMGLTPRACLREVRLQRARALLQDRQLSVKAVAFSVGYRQRVAQTSVLEVCGCSGENNTKAADLNHAGPRYVRWLWRPASYENSHELLLGWRSHIPVALPSPLKTGSRKCSPRSVMLRSRSRQKMPVFV